MISHHRSRPRPLRARRGERGVALVEIAFVGLALFTLAAGTFDYGWAWRSGLAVNEAARSGARIGSGQMLSPAADYYALTGARAALASSGKLDDVERIVIFKATSSNGRVPSSCTAASPSGTCNVLTGAQLKALVPGSFTFTSVWDPDAGDSSPQGSGCLRSGSALLAGWCPNARNNNLQAGPDYYGVWIKYRHKFQFPILGSGTDVTRTAVMRLEPDSY